MSRSTKHPYHIVDNSIWPLYSSVFAFYLTSGLVVWFNHSSKILLIVGLVSILFVILQWWRDVRVEGSFIGFHTKVVELGLRWRIVLFIISEIFFFVRFFWSYFHIRLSADTRLGNNWPPLGVTQLHPFTVPLINTIILLRSGIRVTWRHHRILFNDSSEAKTGLIITIIMGVYFTVLQYLEYIEADFRICDRVYGRCFFIGTGFHGLHVLVGTTFLLATYLRLEWGHLSRKHHFGFEAAAWYWHFVDVVWLFLFYWFYVWPYRG